MPRGGKRPNAGRKKRDLRKIVEVSPAVVAVKGPPVGGLTTEDMPLDYMLRVMRDRTAEWKRRDEMAKAAAPFCHEKLSPKPAGGKKAAEEEAAMQAGRDSDWSDDLTVN